MMRIRGAAGTVAVLLSAALASCAQDSPSQMGTGHLGNGQMDRGGPMAMSHLMREAIPESESDYLSTMVAHHAEAVAAAQQLVRSDRPAMRALGRAIVASQTLQIEQMNDWLARWHPDVPAPAYEPMMRDLTGLDGETLDRAFLVDMVPHHMSAVMMSRFLLTRGLAEHPAVAALAAGIAKEQAREIRVMTRWLHTWYGLGHHGGMGMGMGAAPLP
jgi:uncharacterized protein (DUF305 family)